MDGQFIEILESYPLGNGLIIIFGGIATVFGIYKLISEIKHIYDNKIKKESEKEKDFSKFQDNVTSSLKELQKVNNSVKELNDSVNNLQRNFNNFQTDTINSLNQLQKNQKEYNEELNTLIESDKESIKSYIIDEYQKWQKAKFIDIYAMQSIETRYEKYLKEHGNTFVATLMDRLRNLPTKYVISIDDDENDDDDDIVN